MAAAERMMSATNQAQDGQEHFVVMRVPRHSVDTCWREAYAFLEGDTASGTYSIVKGNITHPCAVFEYDFTFSDPNTAFEFKLRFS